uniref:Uncharacterized protein n=1 Tax=Arundo donax TaxID=35708 RepID=A0A0A9TVV0_ARUDO
MQFRVDAASSRPRELPQGPHVLPLARPCLAPELPALRHSQHRKAHLRRDAGQVCEVRRLRH